MLFRIILPLLAGGAAAECADDLLGDAAPTPPWPNVVFVKPFKVGGGTMRGILERFAAGHGQSVVPGDPMHHFRVSEKQALKLEGKYNMLTRHGRYGRWMDSVVPDAVYVTLVREPLQRAVSHFYHLNRASRRMSFAEWYRGGRGTEQYDNHMARHLGYRSIDDVTAESLRDRYALIGLTSRFNETLVVMRRLLGWDFPDIFYQYQHLNSHKPRDPVPKDVVAEFERRNQLDYRIYNLARDAFDQHLFNPVVVRETQVFVDILDFLGSRPHRINKKKKKKAG